MTCKDCGPDSKRPSPHPGPRCYTHHLARRKLVSRRAHAQRIAAKFGISADEYAALYAAQGGVCYVCCRATGKTRRLAVDHDHKLAATHDHPVEQACRSCVRGLACNFCNRDVLGRLGDTPDTYARIATALRVPPAVHVLLREVSA